MALGVLLLAGAVVPAETQELDAKIEDLRERAVPVRSIDPADDDFSDLAALTAAIGDARIVQLGESTHGDGAAFAAKTRLVKFLHRELGFDVLVWESGMYDLRVVNDSLRAEADPAASALLGVFPIWSATREVLPLFEYARDSHAGDRPLEMAGVDIQFSGREIGDLEADLDRFIDGIEDETVSHTATTLARPVIEGYRRFIRRESARREHVLELRGRGVPGPALSDSMRVWQETRAEHLEPTPPDLARYLTAADALLEFFDGQRSDLARSHGTLETAFMERVLGNLREFGITQFERNFAGRPTEGPEALDLSKQAWNRRDARKADNLRWLAEVMYPDRKLVVWAHNGHIMNAHYSPDLSALLHEPVAGGMTPMGVMIAEELGDGVYTLAFTAFSGEYGSNVLPSVIGPMPKGSVEGLLHELGHDQAFLDFRSLPPGHWLRRPTAISIRGYTPEIMDDWTKVVDGIFFIDRMTPTTPIGRP